MNELASQVTASGIVVWVLQSLKKANWFPWITEHSDTVTRIWAVVLAAATSAGISYTYDPSAGMLTISGATLAGVLSFLWKVVSALVFQELIYRGAVKAHSSQKSQ
jgi:hypothetical protein